MFPSYLTHDDLHGYITDSTHHLATCPVCGAPLNQED